MQIDLATIVAVLLSAGGGMAVVQFVRAFKDARSGARAGVREVVNDLRDSLDDTDNRYREAAADRDFWRSVASRRGGQLLEAHIEPADEGIYPPSERGPRRRPTPRNPATPPPALPADGDEPI